MKIAIDAMGGDHAPQVMVEAVAQISLEDSELELAMVGNQPQVEALFKEYDHNPDQISFVHTDVVIAMDDPPTTALREKKDSSISTAIKLHKEKKVEAVISAGNTGAVVAGSLLGLGRIKGVSRPAISTLFPTQKGHCIMLDVGANSACKPMQLLQFGYMGSIYAEHVLNIKNPTVGLLSIGEERVKGNELTVETNKLLEESTLNFVGNIEGNDPLKGVVNVVVCDGFVGNVVIKHTESILHVLKDYLKKHITASLRYKLGAWLLKPMALEFARDFNYEEYGGAPLLGIDGVTIISHGSSSPAAIISAIRRARAMVKENINGIIQEKLEPASHE